MFRRALLPGTRLAIAIALASGASGVALADDSTMNPFTGDFYRELHGGQNLGDSVLGRATQAPARDSMASTATHDQRRLTEIGRRLAAMPTPIFSDKGA